MRAIWKGAVSFGLVNVPVRLYSATENHDVQFRQVHRDDGGRIKYQRVCSIDGEQVAYDDIAKGYETEDGQMVVLTDEDLAELPVSSSREIAVEKFVPADQIDPMLLEKSYYLEPDKAAAKPYALLRDALKAADRMAVVTVSIRTRMTVAVLRVRDDVIVMQTMLWPDEVRSPEFANLGDAESAAKPAELKMANMLVESLAGDYDPDDYEDDYQQAVEAVVRAKLEGGEVARGRRAAPRTARARSSTCWPRCSAASSGPRPPAASPPATTAGEPADDAADDGAEDTQEAAGPEAAPARKRARAQDRRARARPRPAKKRGRRARARRPARPRRRRAPATSRPARRQRADRCPRDTPCTRWQGGCTTPSPVRRSRPPARRAGSRTARRCSTAG